MEYLLRIRYPFKHFSGNNLFHSSITLGGGYLYSYSDLNDKESGAQRELVTGPQGHTASKIQTFNLNPSIQVPGSVLTTVLRYL